MSYMRVYFSDGRRPKLVFDHLKQDLLQTICHISEQIKSDAYIVFFAVTDSAGRHPLRLVAEKGDILQALLLLQWGATLDPRTLYPHSPLDAAIANSDIQFVEFLHGAGYDVRQDRLLSEQSCQLVCKRLAPEDMAQLDGMRTNVMSLFNLSRNSLRGLFRRDFRSSVASLSLPPYLKSMLIYT